MENVLAVQAAEARHEAIRAFMAERYPGCQVIDIREEAHTSYLPMLSGGPSQLARIEIDYQVEAVPGPGGVAGIRCHLLIDDDGIPRVASDLRIRE